MWARGQYTFRENPHSLCKGLDDELPETRNNKKMNAWLQIWKCNISQGERQSCSLYCNPVDNMQMCAAQLCSAQCSLSVFGKQVEQAACCGWNAGIQDARRLLSLAHLQEGTGLSLWHRSFWENVALNYSRWRCLYDRGSLAFYILYETGVNRKMIQKGTLIWRQEQVKLKCWVSG